MSILRAKVLKVTTSNKIHKDGQTYDRVKLQINNGKRFEVSVTPNVCVGQKVVNYDTVFHEVTRIPQPASAQTQE